MSTAIRTLPVNDTTPVSEVIKVVNSLVNGYSNRFLMTPLVEEPADKYEGMVVYADGVTWNPHGGEGLYFYDGSGWQKMGENAFIFPDSTALGGAPPTETGTVAGVQVMGDGTIHQVNEVAGSAGQYCEFLFSGLTEIRGVIARIDYSGSNTHTVEVAIYNYNLTQYDTIFVFSDSGNYVSRTVIFDGTHYVDGSGNANIRYTHISSGISGHQWKTDLLALLV